MKKSLFIITILSGLLLAFTVIAAIQGGVQGGTGIGSATSSDVGKFLQVTSSSPFLLYGFGNAGSGSFTTSTLAGLNNTIWYLNGTNGITIATTSATSSQISIGVSGYPTFSQVSSSLYVPGFITATSSAFIATTTGNWIGTWQNNSPSGLLYSAGFITATSTALTSSTITGTSVSSTNAFHTYTTSTNLFITSVTNSLLATDANGKVIATSTSGGSNATNTQIISKSWNAFTAAKDEVLFISPANSTIQNVSAVNTDTGDTVKFNLFWDSARNIATSSAVALLTSFQTVATNTTPIMINSAFSSSSRFDVSTSSPLGLYHFENNSNNAISGSFNGVDSNAIYTINSKIQNYAVSYSSGYSETGVMPLSTSSFSMLGWVYLNSNSEQGSFFMNGDAGLSTGFGLFVGNTAGNNAGNHLLALDSGGWENGNVNIGTGWHFVVATEYTPGTVSFFLDGADTGMRSINTQVAGTGHGTFGNAWFGGAYGTFALGSNNRADEWFVGNASLTSSTISTIYNGGSGSLFCSTSGCGGIKYGNKIDKDGVLRFVTTGTPSSTSFNISIGLTIP